MDHKRQVFYFLIFTLLVVMPIIISRVERDNFYAAEIEAEVRLQNHKLKYSRLLRQIVIGVVQKADCEIIKISNRVNFDSLCDAENGREKREEIMRRIREARTNIEACEKNVSSECADRAYRDYQELSAAYSRLKSD